MRRWATGKTVLPSSLGTVVPCSVGTTSFFCYKFHTLEKNLKNHDIVCLQETKGTQSLINKHFRKLSRTFWVVPNLSPRSVNEGGLITLVSKSSCPLEEYISHTVMVPGRVSRVLIQGAEGRQIVYNTHNQEFTNAQMDIVCKSILNDLSDCSTDTLRNNLIACGDFNIPSVAGRYFDYARPIPVACTDAGLEHHPRFHGVKGRLGKVLKDKRFVEVEPMAPTRYNHLNNTGSTIDRIFINTAPCFLKLCRWSSSILQDPKKLYTNGISDHGFVQARAVFLAPPVPGEGVIPLPYIDCPTFKKIFSQLCYETRVRFVDCPWMQKELLAELIKTAALFTREFLQDYAADTDIFVKDQLLASISRVIWAQNHRIAHNMITASPIAAKHLEVSYSDGGSSNSASLKDSQAFSDICNSTRTSVISKLASENNDRPNCVSKSNTSSKLARLAKLWITFGKSLILHGVIVSDDIITDEPARTLALGSAWQNVFSSQGF